MEWKQNGEALIVFGTIIIIVLCAIVVIFIINQKRKFYNKQMLIDMYENDLKLRVEKLEADNVRTKNKLGLNDDTDLTFTKNIDS